MPNRGAAVYYIALFEMGLPRRGMFCIILVYPIARARANARARGYTRADMGGVARCMLTWRYAGLHTSGTWMHFLRVSLNKIARRAIAPAEILVN